MGNLSNEYNIECWPNDAPEVSHKSTFTTYHLNDINETIEAEHHGVIQVPH
jgi:hypothetical protein